MKIAAEVYGVEQAVDFDTLETTQYVVLGVFGETVRVPISEAQMERLVRQRTAGSNVIGPDLAGEIPGTRMDRSEEMEETKAGSDEEVFTGPMSGLEGIDNPPPSQDDDRAERDPGLGGLFEETEENKEAKLRASQRGKLSERRTVPQDSAGNPVVPQANNSGLPPVSFGNMNTEDEGFPQG